MNSIFGQRVKRYIGSFLLSFIITLFIISAASIVFTFLPPSDRVLGFFSSYSYLLSAFLAAFFSSRTTSKRGFLSGIIASFFYISALLVLGLLIFKNVPEATSLIRIYASSSVCGALGGIAGINSK